MFVVKNLNTKLSKTVETPDEVAQEVYHLTGHLQFSSNANRLAKLMPSLNRDCKFDLTDNDIVHRFAIEYIKD